LSISLLIPCGAAATPPGDARPAAAAERPFGARDLDLDVTPARDVLALWRQSPPSRSTARRIARALPYRTLRGFFFEQFGCAVTEQEVARALTRPDSGACGFGLDPAYRERAALAEVVSEIQTRGPELTRQVASDAARYLPLAPSWQKVRVWFVIASQTMFDAVTLQTAAAGDSVPLVLVNLSDVLHYGTTASERVDVLSHVLAHEVFHAGLREVAPGLPGWAWYRGAPRSGFAFIASAMVDEGVAHYIDWRGRPGSDSLFTWAPSRRETHSFSQLALACKRLRERSGSVESRMEVLQLASVGPLWSKYGAISGMFAAYRIEMARGLDALREAIAAGPEEFLRVYGEVAAGNPSLSPPPKELVGRR